MVGERVPEIKAKILAAVAQAPCAPRVEEGALGAGRNVWKSLHIDVYVRAAAIDSEGLVLSVNHQRR